MPGEPPQLVECVQELREAMEPLTTFMDAEVFSNDVSSNWVKVTSSRTSYGTYQLSGAKLQPEP